MDPMGYIYLCFVLLPSISSQHHGVFVPISTKWALLSEGTEGYRRKASLTTAWPRKHRSGEFTIAKFQCPYHTMGLEYLPIWMVDFYGKCRETMGNIPVSCMGYVLVSCFSNIDLWISMIWSGWFFCVFSPCFFWKILGRLCYSSFSVLDFVRYTMGVAPRK